MPGGAEAFPKHRRLRTRREFLRVQDGGAKVAAGPLLALSLPNRLGHTRLGLTISTKVGGAVERVRIRRHLRELFRKRRGELPEGLDLVLVARNSANGAPPEAFARAFGEIARRLRAVRPAPTAVVAQDAAGKPSGTPE